MVYYPSSQIKSNLYTNGFEFILSTTQEFYIGYYYKLSNGNRYTGHNPNDTPSILLLKTTKNLSQDEGLGLNLNLISSSPTTSYPIITNIRSLPQPNITLPTSKDYELGKFTRYFAKKNNELRYLEIDKQTHKSLTSSDIKIAWDLYSSITVIWSLTGEQDKVFLTNKNIVSLAEQRNKWYGFSQWFRDNFLKYYLASK